MVAAGVVSGGVCLRLGCPRKLRNAVAGKQRELKFLQSLLGNGATSNPWVQRLVPPT